MPELPEVETVRRRLESSLKGRKITRVTVHWPRTVERPSKVEFERSLPGHTIKSVKRRGKYLVIELAPCAYLLAHLRMSGDLIIGKPGTLVSRWVRAEIELDKKISLQFDDTRKFGKLYLVKQATEVIGKLGPEPLDPGFTEQNFYSNLHQKKGAIKPLLLNQSFLAGLGNIYVVEALWRAKIHPLKPANRVSETASNLLFRSIRRILNEAIESSGTDIGDGVWDAGGYRTRVYGREGRPCQRCKSLIKRIVVGQRGTEFCPSCQKR